MRRLAAALALVLLSTSLACGSDQVSGPSAESMIGTWNLTTVNGAPLPWVFQADPKEEILSDQIITLADGTFTEAFEVRFTDASGTSTEIFPESGFWTLRGTSMIFQFSDGSVASAIAGDGTFTFGGSGGAQVFVKQ